MNVAMVGSITYSNSMTELVILFTAFLVGIIIAVFTERIIRWWYWTGMTIVSKLGLKLSDESDEIIMTRWINSWYHKIFIWILRIMAIILCTFFLFLTLAILYQFI
jgi:hypothetical protein